MFEIDDDTRCRPDREAGAVRVGPLVTSRDLRKELGRLYRTARRTAGNDIDPRDARALASVLGVLQRSIETDALEERIVALERAAGSRR